MSYKPPDSKLNLPLFKPFTQPRNTGGDSKTAPSSPLTSPSDTRSFFKVPEMEAKIEDTKRRLSEVIYEPFQLLSKIMGEESGSHRPKALSSSASELSNLSSLNGHLESSNNYSIKEEDGDSEGDGCGGSDPSAPTGDHPRASSEPPREAEPKSSSQGGGLKDLGLKTSSLVLEKCSLSALVSKEDEEFCELYSEDFDLEAEAESTVDKLPESPLKPAVLAGDGPALDSEDEAQSAVQHPELPVKTLGFLIMCVYGYLVLPLPHYVNGLLLGIGLGFMTAVCMIWFFTPPSAHKYHRLHKNRQHWNTRSLDIQEPEMLKVSPCRGGVHMLSPGWPEFRSSFVFLVDGHGFSHKLCVLGFGVSLRSPGMREPSLVNLILDPVLAAQRASRDLCCTGEQHLHAVRISVSLEISWDLRLAEDLL